MTAHLMPAGQYATNMRLKMHGCGWCTSKTADSVRRVTRGLTWRQAIISAFVDSDDYVEPSMYDELLQVAKAHQADVVHANYYKEQANGKQQKVIFVQNETVFSGREQVDQYMLDLVGTGAISKKDSLYGVSVWKGLYKGHLIREHGLRFLSERIYVSGRYSV